MVSQMVQVTFINNKVAKVTPIGISDYKEMDKNTQDNFTFMIPVNATKTIHDVIGKTCEEVQSENKKSQSDYNKHFNSNRMNPSIG